MHTQQLPWHRSHTWWVGPGHQHWHLALYGDVSSRSSVKKHLRDPKTTPVFSGRSQNVFGYNVTSQRQESAVAGRGVVSRARRALTPEGQAPRFRVVSAPQHARTCRAAGTTSSLRVFTENHVPGTALGAAPKPEVQPGRHTRRHLINLIMRYRPPLPPEDENGGSRRFQHLPGVRMREERFPRGPTAPKVSAQSADHVAAPHRVLVTHGQHGS